ncbi:MAG: multicopper oxidase [Clostridia bacterium]|nr:multicopper oxidase [Clostridia bacterium]
MLFPDIPNNICPNINFSRDDIVNLLLNSIAFEELGIAHLINEEAEMIQSALGTLKGQHVKNPVIDELLRIDKAVGQVLEDIIKKEILLGFKFEDILEVLKNIPQCEPSKPKSIPKYKDPLPIPRVLEPKRTDQGATYYEVEMREVRQKLHKCFPETTVWGYEGSYPGPTIEARRNELVRVKWINNLPDKHILPVDKTIHGAEPQYPEVRAVVHLHDGNTPADSDGHPDAWFTRDFAVKGPKWVHEVYEYPNDQEATTLWYHDHALGITRLNVYAGLAAFYILRDDNEDSLNLPKGKYEIPIVIQDRLFNDDGSLFYPRQPDPPIPGVDPSIVPEFFGEIAVVNGKVWPFLNVEPRKYRFRLLNGSDSRFYRLSLSSGQPFIQIGVDGGLLEKPVLVNELLLAPAERADVVLDFSAFKDQCILLTNDAASPFPNGDAPDPDTIGQIMQFRVALPLSSPDTSTVPPNLNTISWLKESDAVLTRDLTLVESEDPFGRLILLLNGLEWDAPVTENPKLGSVEIWRLINATPDTHPIHPHLIRFQILDRQPFNISQFEDTGEIVFTGPAVPPEPNEKGFKDTVRANPGEVTRFIARFGDFSGHYVWHCHILEHEDHEMMRPFDVIP